jgi:hypothetical protein
MKIPSLIVKVGVDATKLDKGLDNSQKRLAAFAKKAAIASAAVATATVVAFAALGRRSFEVVDAQAKLAESLGTTTASIQNLSRAGQLAGVPMSNIEQATKDLTRRLSQAAAGAGPAAKALKLLQLSAEGLAELPLDKRVLAINDAIEKFVPIAQRAAVAGMLFGEEGSIAMSRLDGQTLQRASEEVRLFGAEVSELDAKKIEDANDAMSRLSLVFTAIGTTIATSTAGPLKDFSDALADIWVNINGPVLKALEGFIGVLDELAIFIGSFALVMATSFVGSLILAATNVGVLATAMGILNAIMAVNPFILAATALAGLAVLLYKLSQRLDGIGNMFVLLGDVAVGVWRKIQAGGTFLSTNLQLVGVSISDSFTKAFNFIALEWAKLLDKFANSTTGKFGEWLGFEMDGGSAMFESARQSAMATGKQAGDTKAKVAEMISTMKDAQDLMNQPVSGMAELREAFNNTAEPESVDNTTKTKPKNDITSGLEEVATAAEIAKAKLDEIKNSADAVASSIQSSMTTAFMSIVDGTSSVKDAFKSMARNIIKQLYEVLVVQRLVGSFTAGVGGNASTGSGIVGGVMKLFGFEGGGYTGSGSRSGGVDGKGGFPAIVHPNETIIDHTKGQSVGGGESVTVIQNNTFGSGVSRAEVNAMLPKMVEATKAAVVDAKLRGGSYGRSFA